MQNSTLCVIICIPILYIFNIPFRILSVEFLLIESQKIESKCCEYHTPKCSPFSQYIHNSHLYYIHYPQFLIQSYKYLKSLWLVKHTHIRHIKILFRNSQKILIHRTKWSQIIPRNRHILFLYHNLCSIV